jgi:SWIM zinc finger
MAQVAELGIPERHGDGWQVPSASGPGFHFVHLRPHLRCTCSAWIFGHGTPCTHIRAVKALLAKESEVGVA